MKRILRTHRCLKSVPHIKPASFQAKLGLIKAGRVRLATVVAILLVCMFAGSLSLPFVLAQSGQAPGKPGSSRPMRQLLPRRPLQNPPASNPAASNSAASNPANANRKENGPTGAANRNDGGRSKISDAAAKIAVKPQAVGESNVDRESPPKQAEANTTKESNSIAVASEMEKNQVIAPDWKKPWACLFVTGRQHGYIEPCGCTGLENQKGGLNRRDTLLQSLVNRGWDVVPIDAGDQVQRRGKQSEIKFSKTALALKMMDYKAVMYGPDELKLSSSELFLALTNNNGLPQSPFLAANVGIFSQNDPDRYKIIEVGGKRIGITGVLGDSLAKEVGNSDLVITPAKGALKEVALQLKAARCDFLILIAHAPLEESEELARVAPIFNLVITAGGYGEPLYKPEPIEGTRSVMIQVGVKGMYAGVVGLYDDPQEPIVYQRVALSSQFEDSPRIMDLFAKYQKELEQFGLAGLGLRPLSHPTTREFVGSEKCGECHTTAFDIWKDTPHAHATDSIIKPPGRGQVPRHFDPECLSCHVTGWNPSEYYPYVSGYTSLEATPHLVANGCENCHGPGAAHAAAESGDVDATVELLARLRDEMKLPLSEAHDTCTKCHDMDNSPAFHNEGAFEEYWEKVKHYGKD